MLLRRRPVPVVTTVAILLLCRSFAQGASTEPRTNTTSRSRTSSASDGTISETESTTATVSETTSPPATTSLSDTTTTSESTTDSLSLDTSSLTVSQSSSNTQSPTASVSETTSQSGTESVSDSKTASMSNSVLSTVTASKTFSPSITLPFSDTKTTSLSSTLSLSESQTESLTDSRSQSITVSASNAESSTGSVSKTMSPSVTQPLSDTRTTSPSSTESVSDTKTGSESATSSPSQPKTVSSSITESLSNTESSTDSVSKSPSPSASQSSSDSKTTSQSATKSSSDTKSASVKVSKTPSATLTRTESVSLSRSASTSDSQTVSMSISSTAVHRISPAVASRNLYVLNMTIYNSRPGQYIFMMKATVNGRLAYNCSRPPPIGTLRTPLVPVKFPGNALFNVKNLEVDEYILCLGNVVSGITSTFQQLPQTFRLSGDIDAGRSRMCCDGPFVVGNRTYCTITAVDEFGNPAGTPADSCKMRVCTVTDGRGEPVHNYVQPYYVAPGVFRFHFTAYHSGCGGSAGATYNGNAFGKMFSYFTLLPGRVDYTMATSECRVAYDRQGQIAPICAVVQRDGWNNPIRRCQFDTTGKVRCQSIHITGR